MKPAFLTITQQRGHTTRKPGNIINGHRLVEPVGNGRVSDYWRYACGSCGSVHVIARNNMNNLRKTAGCRICADKNRRKKVENEPDGLPQI